MRLIFPSNTKSFTLVETLIVAGVMGIITAGLLLALQTGGASWLVGTSVADVESELRRAAGWIAKDVRQAYLQDIGTVTNTPTPYTPSSSHIKFRTVTGYNAATGQVLLSPGYIDYTYNSGSTLETITRTDLSNNRTWTFYHIIQSPFYTNAAGVEKVIDPVGGISPILTSKNLMIKLVGQQDVKNGATPVYTLTDEVKIRNE